MANASSHVAHHFTDANQQYESAKLGMWVFLLTEVLLFGGLFVAYAVFRAWHPEMFINAHKELSIPLGTLNTIVLITSSLTMALAIREIQLGNKTKCLMHLAATLGFAAVFLIVKYFEYSHKFHLGQLPGKFYSFPGIEGTNPHIFFSAYFLMTGLHGFHILVGIGAISWVFYKVVHDQLSPQHFTSIEVVGLYWHLVDLIWIYLFPLFYLIG